jgi:hypothetical protein
MHSTFVTDDNGRQWVLIHDGGWDGEAHVRRIEKDPSGDEPKDKIAEEYTLPAVVIRQACVSGVLSDLRAMLDGWDGTSETARRAFRRPAEAPDTSSTDGAGPDLWAELKGDELVRATASMAAGAAWGPRVVAKRYVPASRLDEAELARKAMTREAAEWKASRERSDGLALGYALERDAARKECEAALCRIATLEKLLTRAALDLERATDIMVREGVIEEEDDGVEEREFVAEIRAAMGMPDPTKGDAPE